MDEENVLGVEIVYAGPGTFLRQAFEGDATGKWFPTFTQARKQAIEMLREPRDRYNEAIERFKKLTKDQTVPAFGPVGYIRG